MNTISQSRQYLYNPKTYQADYARSINEPEQFWKQQAETLNWIRFPKTIQNCSFAQEDVAIRWYEDGQLNVAENCIDRHLATRANDTAIIWEGDDPGQSKRISFQELHDEVCRLANALKNLGVEKGDRVAVYMPMIPEVAYAMLACARIGAVHSVIFAGFSPNAIADRINDCGAKVILSADQGVRGGRAVALKTNIDEALANNRCPSIEHSIFVRADQHSTEKLAPGSHWWHEVTAKCATTCQPEVMNAEDPLFILYTSGSTGKPKGVLHTTGGYLVYASVTHKAIFDYQPGEVYWCAADAGWITGHSYIVYGPLANGATTLMFEGIPTYPDERRIGQIVDKHKVNILYTAPTAIRALMCRGGFAAEGSTRESLRLLGSVGEPINPEAWHWYHQTIGNGNCPIIDTWWQTETGACMMVPLPGVGGETGTTKPGAASQPFFGVEPALLDSEGQTLEGEAEGNLVIKRSWPGQARTLWGDHERFVQTYFSTYANCYFTGDGCRRDADGDYWITGRVDDVLNVSGHRLGTAEIESTLVAHETVAEAAVVGYPHDIKGQGIYVYVTPVTGVAINDELTKTVRDWVRSELSPIATPDFIQWTPALPKTRSGKIMRRILRKIAANDFTQLGDTSTLADPGVVEPLIENRLNK